MEMMYIFIICFDKRKKRKPIKSENNDHLSPVGHGQTKIEVQRFSLI